MKILCIGGTGHISIEVVKLAVTKGNDVYLLNRGNHNELRPPNVKCFQADIYDKDEVAGKIGQETFDVIIDFLSYKPEQLQDNLNQFRDKFQQYIFISSVAVYQTTSIPGITEFNTPTMNLAWDYARNKIACEQTLAKEHLLFGTIYTIVRPGETYGNLRIPGVLVPQPHHYSIIDRMAKGKSVVVHDDGKALCSITHASDFAKGCYGLLLNPLAYGEAFHITSDESLTWQTITEIVAETASLQADIVHIPSLDITRLMPRTSYGDTYGVILNAKAHHKVFDNTKIKSVVPGFNCETPFRKGIRQTLEFFWGHPQYQTIDQNWNQAMDQLIAAYAAGAGIEMAKFRLPGEKHG